MSDNVNIIKPMHILPNEISSEYNNLRSLPKLCYAPFSSLYFRIDGDVHHCCYNYSVPIGKYPENSISEIWQSVVAKNNRLSIANNTLPAGCDICFEHLTHKNYASVGARNFDYYNHYSSMPQCMEFELTNTCNLECVMCSEWNSSAIQKRQNRAQRDMLYSDKFISELKPFLKHLRKVNFLGGEPFLIDIYYDIWRVIIEENPDCNICIITNGTIMNERVLQLMQASNRLHFIVSLDSVNPDTYRNIRRNANLPKVLDNIKIFNEYTKKANTYFQISCCFMKNNWKDIPNVVRYCNTNNIPIYFNIVCQPSNLAVLSLSKEKKDEIATFFSAQEDILTPHNNKNYSQYIALTKLVQN